MPAAFPPKRGPGGLQAIWHIGREARYNSGQLFSPKFPAFTHHLRRPGNCDIRYIQQSPTRIPRIYRLSATNFFLPAFTVPTESNMADQIQEILDVPREFVKEGVQFLNRCQKRTILPIPVAGSQLGILGDAR